MYARRLNGEVLDFDHRGWLYEESFLFYDLKTDSLWVQATGEAVHGRLRGSRLQRLPATQTTWSQWRRQHPDTLVLGRPASLSPKYHRDSYADYYATGRGINYKRYKALEFGLAVVLPTGQKLYPLAELAKSPVVHDELADRPVLIVYHPASRTAVAFGRLLGDQRLDFQLDESQAHDVLLKDAETGSKWSGLTGRCLSGPLQDRQLAQLTTTQFVVENWPLHYPAAAIYSADKK